MSSTGLIVVGFGLAATISALVIWVLTLKFKEVPLTLDEQKVVNFLPQYTNGYAKGNVIEIIHGDKRTGIKFMPTDADFKELNKGNSVVIEPKLVWVKHKIHISKGELSANQDEIWLLPQSSTGFTDEFQQSILGKALMKIIEDKNDKITSEQLVIKRLNSLERLANKTYGNELIDEFSEKVQEILSDVAKLTNKDKQTSLFGKTDEN